MMADPSKPAGGRGGTCLGQAIAFATLCAVPACLTPEADEWNPRPAMLEHAFKVHPKLDATDLEWTRIETWVVQGPYLHGWLVTGWTVDRETQTVHMDWSKIEEVR